MPTLSRRTFLASLATAVPLAVVVRRAHAAAVVHLASEPATLDALAEAVLPSALGRAGIAKQVAAFREWGAGYREGAELNHGYGTSRLRSLGPTPLTKWTTQLDDLDTRAQAKTTKPFCIKAYRRLTAQGEVILLKQVIASIHVKGRHWGIMQMAYQDQG